MRNLKRVLSLALALVMVLGMMVITTSAATFADDAEITNKEAVEVMSALGILEGDGTNFDPNGTLTRAQAAKLIAYMLGYGETAEKLSAEGLFTDVGVGMSNWASGYIAFCASRGYIAGNGDGTFNPTGELTDIALGKMVLCALGADAEEEGYVNDKNWAANVSVDMIDIGLAEKVTGTAISREDAAAMILEGMKYSPSGKVYTVYNVEFDNLYDAVVFGKLANASFTATVGTGTHDVKVANASDCLLTEVYGVYCVGGTDDFGRPATTYTNYINFEMDFVDEAVMTSSKAISNTELYNTLGYKAVLYKSGSQLTTTTATEGFLYNNNGTTYAIGTSLTPATENYGVGGNGIWTEIYNVDDRNTPNIVEHVVVQIQAQLAVVGQPSKTAESGTRGAYTTYPLTLVGGGSVALRDYTTVVNAALDKDNYNSELALAKNDVVLVYANGSNYTVAAAESISGTIEKISKGTYTIDGIDYKLADNEQAAPLTLTGAPASWYVDAYGYIIGDKAGAAVTDYLYVLNTDLQSVTAWGKTSKALNIQAILPDGTLAVYEVAVTGITSANEAAYEAAYSVSVEQGDYVVTGTDIVVYDADDASSPVDNNKDDTNVKGKTFHYAADEDGVLYLAATNNVSASMTIGGTYVSPFTGRSTNSAVVAAGTTTNSDTVYVYYNAITKKVETYTGTEIRGAFTTINGIAVGKAFVAGSMAANVVYVTGGSAVSAGAGNAAVFVDASERVDTLDKKGDPLYTYTAYDATGAVVYVTATSTTGIADGLYVPNTKGEISGAPAVTSATASVAGGTLKVGDNYYNMGNAAVIDLTRDQTGTTTATFKAYVVLGDGVKVPATDVVVVYITD